MKLHPEVFSRLQGSTLYVPVCVWPGCETELRDSTRVGAICIPHARQVHDAVEVLTNCRITADDLEYIGRIERDIDAMQRERRARSDANRIQPGWVYYVAVGERIKVGFATDVNKRLRAYPPESTLLAVHPGTPTLEKDMHNKLAVWRVAGREWYSRSDEVLAHIDRVLAEFGPPPAKFQPAFREPGRPRTKQGPKPKTRVSVG